MKLIKSVDLALRLGAWRFFGCGLAVVVISSFTSVNGLGLFSGFLGHLGVDIDSLLRPLARCAVGLDVGVGLTNVVLLDVSA